LKPLNRKLNSADKGMGLTVKKIYFNVKRLNSSIVNQSKVISFDVPNLVLMGPEEIPSSLMLKPVVENLMRIYL